MQMYVMLYIFFLGGGGREREKDAERSLDEDNADSNTQALIPVYITLEHNIIDFYLTLTYNFKSVT